MMVYNIEFYAYLPKIWIYFFFISISGRIWSRIRNIFPAEPDLDPWKKMSDPHPCTRPSFWIQLNSVLSWDRSIPHIRIFPTYIKNIILIGEILGWFYCGTAVQPLPDLLHPPACALQQYPAARQQLIRLRAVHSSGFRGFLKINFLGAFSACQFLCVKYCQLS